MYFSMLPVHETSLNIQQTGRTGRNNTRLAVHFKCLVTVVHRAMSYIFNTYSHFFSCHDHISDVMKQAVVIAECRLSCHYSILGPERQLSICHQDVRFFRADPQSLTMQKSQMCHGEPVILLLTSSSVVDCECSALSNGTWSETWSYSRG